MTLATWKKGHIAVMVVFFMAYGVVLVADIQPMAAYGDVIELVGIIVALCAFNTGIRAHAKDDRLPWIYFALTAFCSLVGEGLWSYYGHILDRDPGSPSICDIFYISYTFFCIAGIVFFVRQDKEISLKNFSADLVISLVAAAGLMYIFLIAPALEDAQQVSMALILQISYPIFDYGILFGCLSIFFNAGRESYGRSSLINLLLGFFCMLAADQLNLLAELHDLDIVSFIEPLWALAYCFLAVSCILSAEEKAMQKSMQRHIAGVVSIDREKAMEVTRMLLPYLMILSALCIVFIQYRLYNFAVYWAMFLIVVLSVRQFCVLMSNKRLNTELVKLNLKATRDAQMDFLTKLANRRHIDDVLSSLGQEATDTTLGILFLDVDFFKHVNDTYGHDAGDAALRGVADVIRNALRNTDMAGRFGGDEFIAILPGADTHIVAAVGERIIERVRADSSLAALHVTLSIGGASVPVGSNIQALLKSADAALYEAKEAGRDRLVIAEGERHESVGGQCRGE